jgi:uncharacterized DUF497 family protein
VLWWTESSEEHIARHGVTIEEVTDVVAERTTRWFRITRQPLYRLYGRTEAGRYLLVVLVPSTDDPGAWYVATAREMSRSEQARHRCER